MKRAKKKADLADLRIKLDQMTEQIVSGLKHRSKFLLNEKVFTQKFFGGKTWFLYRLKAEQNVDAEFGRYLYSNQHPFIFSLEGLSKPKIARHAPKLGLKRIRIDLSEEIICAYREVLKEICENREEGDNYGSTAKLDVENILLYNERILGIGEQVAAYKLRQNPEIKKIKSKEKIRKLLVVPKRECEVLERARKIASKYEIKNPKAVVKFVKKIINLTTEAEIRYVLESEKR